MRSVDLERQIVVDQELHAECLNGSSRSRTASAAYRNASAMSGHASHYIGIGRDPIERHERILVSRVRSSGQRVGLLAPNRDRFCRICSASSTCSDPPTWST